MILAVAMLTALVAFFVWVEGFCTTTQSTLMCRVIFAILLMFACYNIYSHQGVYWKW